MFVHLANLSVIWRHLNKLECAAVVCTASELLLLLPLLLSQKYKKKGVHINTQATHEPKSIQHRQHGETDSLGAGTIQIILLIAKFPHPREFYHCLKPHSSAPNCVRSHSRFFLNSFFSLFASVLLTIICKILPNICIDNSQFMLPTR